jgi:hypothetical protein
MLSAPQPHVRATCETTAHGGHGPKWHSSSLSRQHNTAHRAHPGASQRSENDQMRDFSLKKSLSRAKTLPLLPSSSSPHPPPHSHTHYPHFSSVANMTNKPTYAWTKPHKQHTTQDAAPGMQATRQRFPTRCDATVVMILAVHSLQVVHNVRVHVANFDCWRKRDKGAQHQSVWTQHLSLDSTLARVSGARIPTKVSRPHHKQTQTDTSGSTNSQPYR